MPRKGCAWGALEARSILGKLFNGVPRPLHLIMLVVTGGSLQEACMGGEVRLLCPPWWHFRGAGCKLRFICSGLHWIALGCLLQCMAWRLVNSSMTISASEWPGSKAQGSQFQFRSKSPFKPNLNSTFWWTFWGELRRPFILMQLAGDDNDKGLAGKECLSQLSSTFGLWFIMLFGLSSLWLLIFHVIRYYGSLTCKESLWISRGPGSCKWWEETAVEGGQYHDRLLSTTQKTSHSTPLGPDLSSGLNVSTVGASGTAKERPQLSIRLVLTPACDMWMGDSFRSRDFTRLLGTSIPKYERKPIWNQSATYPKRVQK